MDMPIVNMVLNLLTFLCRPNNLNKKAIPIEEGINIMICVLKPLIPRAFIKIVDVNNRSVREMFSQVFSKSTFACTPTTINTN